MNKVVDPELLDANALALLPWQKKGLFEDTVILSQAMSFCSVSCREMNYICISVAIKTRQAVD